MNTSESTRKVNENIQVYVRLRPINLCDCHQSSSEVVDVISHKEILIRQNADNKLTRKYIFDGIFDTNTKQIDVYTAVVAPLIEEVLAGYNCTVFAYGQTGTGKTYTMTGKECCGLMNSSWDDASDVGIIPRALSHLFDELRILHLEYSLRISYLELYNEELRDLLAADDTLKIHIFDDSSRKGSIIIQNLEEIAVHNKDDVYKLLQKGRERRKTASTLMNVQSSRSHTVFSIMVHIKEHGIEGGEEMLKIGKLNLVDLAGSENISKAGNEKAIRIRETVNINQSLLTLGRVITALVERTPHIPYRESKLTRLLQDSLGGRTKTSIIATISPGHKDIEETLNTLEYVHRARHIQNKPEVNQKLTKQAVIKEYTEEIDKLKRELFAVRQQNGIYLIDETYNEMTHKMDSQNRELHEKMLLLKALKDDLLNKERIFNEVNLNLIEKTEELMKVSTDLSKVEDTLQQTQSLLYTTRQQYQESNVVLNSFMKTEKILRHQAMEIMQVADTATSHTQALQETIERRKGVDKQIQTACKHFSERMQDHFALMNANLNVLDQEYIRFRNNLNDELNSGIILQMKHLEESNAKIKAITNFIETTMKENCCNLIECFSRDFHQIAEEQKENIMKFLTDFKRNNLLAIQKITDDLNDLTEYNHNEKSFIKETCKNFMQLLNTNNDTRKVNNRKILNILKSLEHNTEENLQELQQITASITTEEEFLQEEENLIKKFQENLNLLHAKRKQANLKTMNSINLINNNSKVSLNTLNGANELNKAITVEQENFNQLVSKLVSKHFNNCDQTFNKYSNLEKHINEMEQMNSSQLVKITSQLNIYQDTKQKHCNQYKHQTNDLVMKMSMQLENSSNDIQRILEKNYKCMRSHATILKDLNADTQYAFQNYCRTHQEEMALCALTCKTFKTNELKTYSATQKTPLKREFKYPRILASARSRMPLMWPQHLGNECSAIQSKLAGHEVEVGE